MEKKVKIAKVVEISISIFHGYYFVLAKERKTNENYFHKILVIIYFILQLIQYPIKIFSESSNNVR